MSEVILYGVVLSVPPSLTHARGGYCTGVSYGGTSHMRKRLPLGPYSSLCLGS